MVDYKAKYITTEMISEFRNLVYSERWDDLLRWYKSNVTWFGEAELRRFVAEE